MRESEKLVKNKIIGIRQKDTGTNQKKSSVAKADTQNNTIMLTLNCNLMNINESKLI